MNYKDSILSELKSSQPCCKGDHLSRVSISLELKEHMEKHYEGIGGYRCRCAVLPVGKGHAEKIMNAQACSPKYKFFRRFQGGAT